MKAVALLLCLATSGCGVAAVRSSELTEVSRIVRQNYDFAVRADGRLTQLESESAADLKHKKQLSDDLGRIAEALSIFSLRLASMNCTPIIIPETGAVR